MFAEKMLGYKLVTKQTGAGGKICNSVYICERQYVRREYYFAVLMDRKSQGPVMVASSQGGVDIESVAAENPEAILQLPIDINKGADRAAVRDLAQRMGFTPKCVDQATDTMIRLYDLFMEKDATMVEINPMAESANHEGSPLATWGLLVLDAKKETGKLTRLFFLSW
jgi:succinyl-CoA synthetase beta subunit